VAPAIPSDRKVKVALLLPLSGKDAALGRGLLNAAIMAVFDFGDQRLVLQPYDTEGPGGARASAQRALSEEAGLIIGPFFGRQIAEVAELAARRNVNLISFSNDSSVAGSNAFVFGISPAQSLGRVLDFAASKSIMTYATLLPDDSYGRLIAEIVKTQVREAKGSILRSTFYSPNESNYSEAVKSVAEFDERRRGVAAFLKNQGADPLAPPTPARSKDALKRAQKLTTTREVDYQALVLSESGQRLLNLASLIPYYAINTQKVKIIGLNSNLDDRNLLTEPALNGAWFAAPDPSGRREFDKKYAGLFGADAPRLSSLCYDLIGLAAVLARRSESGDFSTATLRSRDGFIGIDGIFRFTPNNTAERGLAILEIQRGGPVVIAKAPTKFSN
ncbi:MAG: penicillin-binding protein activator, partial [Alphaproteobacteria bacterium]|nr:penicillin-binding protein activator [Alphaproteobacteria bacterium]